MGDTRYRARDGKLLQLMVENSVFRRPAATVSWQVPRGLSPARASLFEKRGLLRILDLGCGPARARDYFESRGHSYVGLDLASPRAQVRATGEALPFRARSFDAVLAVASLQYMLHPHRALREIARVLDQGGTATGTVAFLEPWVWGSKVHLTPAGLIELLEEAGLWPRYVWPSWGVGDAIREACAQQPDAARLPDLAPWLADAYRRPPADLSQPRQPPSRNLSVSTSLAFSGAINFHALKHPRKAAARHGSPSP